MRWFARTLNVQLLSWHWNIFPWTFQKSEIGARWFLIIKGSTIIVIHVCWSDRWYSHLHNYPIITQHPVTGKGHHLMVMQAVLDQTCLSFSSVFTLFKGLIFLRFHAIHSSSTSVFSILSSLIILPYFLFFLCLPHLIETTYYQISVELMTAISC